MKRIISFAVILGLLMGFGTSAMAYDFGDFKSMTLVSKAWEALKQGDTEAVLAYTNKTIELYAAEAQKMQAGLSDFPAGEKDEVFKFWALNDVATAYFIQGEAYRRAGMNEEAAAAFKKLVENYQFGQAWDPNGWFWKPADAGKEKLAMIESGSNLDFGDYSSAFLVGQAWRTLEKEEIDAVLAYTDKVLELYEAKAKQMQESLSEYPWQSREQIFKYWALNDVGTALYIRGEALRLADKPAEAKEAFEKLVKEFFYAQTWDPQGWFWKPAEAAQQKLDEMGDV